MARALLVALVLPICAGASEEQSAGAEAGPDPGPGVLRAPVGLTRTQVFEKGSFEVAYRFGYESFDGNMVGVDRVSPAYVAAAGYSVYPLKQEIEEHRIELGWAPIDRLTVMASLPILDKRMENLVVAADQRYGTHAQGPGDLELALLFDLMERPSPKGDQHLHFNVALSCPTGSVSETGTVLTQDGLEEGLLPYRMQLGSGTFDFIPEIVYLGNHGPTAWGFKSWAVLRIGENTRDYRLGAVYAITGWASYDLGRWASGSVRLGWQKWANVFEAVDQGPPSDTLSPARDPKAQGGSRLDLGPGLSFRLPLPGVQLLSVEALWTLHQDLDGPQLAREWGINAGWQWTF
ncbi:MAG: hypothetical protein JRH19_17595 [Deltaproteobacteria bacterium]|nr:hypothetical protein [Deltaproteobacteria bacterium]